MKRVTLKEIAEMAGVHRSTVDKVIHNRKGVSDEVRERIKKIIEEVDYKPNIIGKALAYQKKPMRIAVVLLKVDALKEIKAGVEEAYEEYKSFGLEINYYIVDNLDEAEQLNIIKLLRKKDISGMIINPLNSEKIRNEIDNMTKANIPVVTVNSDIADSSRMCFVGQDAMIAGSVAGKLMGEILGGHGKVAIVTGLYNLKNLVEREQAFEKVIHNGYPGMEIVETVQTEEDKITAFKNTLALLQREKDLKGIYVTCGNVGEIAKAVRVMNKENEIKMISFELYPEIVKCVKEGIVNFTIGQDLMGQGYKSVKVIFENLFFHKKPENEYLKTNIDIRLRENIE